MPEISDDKIKCIYCYEWNRSEVIKKELDQGTEKKAKKGLYVATRKCLTGNKNITVTSESCQYFRPATCFYCNKNGHYVNFLICLNRRYNHLALIAFEKCSNCRQFSLDIKQIIEKFWVNKAKIIQPKNNKRQSSKPRVIKRRHHEERIIKRREKKKPKRTIKRRCHEGRIIKRREKES